MNDHYILDGKTPVPCDLMTWAKTWGGVDKIVEKTKNDGVEVSTVFLGLDHRFDPDGPPMLFETMVFGGSDEQDEICERYSTWEEAEAGHARICVAVFGATE